MSSDSIEVLRERLRDYAEGLAAPVTLHAEDVAELTALIRDALASLSAPKPESAEAVAYQVQDRATGFWIDSHRTGYELTLERGGVAQVIYTAPPLPGASAPFGECGCGKPVDYFDVMGRPSCNKRIRCSEQQASAPVGVEGFDAWWKSHSIDPEFPETMDDRTFAKAAWDAALAQQPAARPPKPTECMNGCPDRQVCDHCQWPSGPDQQPAAVDEAMERVRLGPSRLWQADLVGGQISVERMREILTAALAGQQQGGA